MLKITGYGVMVAHGAYTPGPKGSTRLVHSPGSNPGSQTKQIGDYKNEK
jgi:hypothetical protein